MDHESEASRKEAIDAWLHEHRPQMESQGMGGLLRGIGASFLGPLWIISGSLLAFVSVFLVLCLPLLYLDNHFASVRLIVAVLPLALVGTWYAFSQASDELDSTLELSVDRSDP